MNAVLVSGHDAQSARKVDFHFWGDILARRGWHVDYLTKGPSLISRLKRNTKSAIPPYNEWVSMGGKVRKFTWRPLYHPLFDNRYFNWLTGPVFNLLPNTLPQSALKSVKDADLFIVESGACLMLVPRLAKLCPKAKFIYTVSDRLKTLHAHPAVILAEVNALPHFQLIRIPAAIMKDDFPPGAPVYHINPGLEKSIFDQAVENPYTTPKNAISVGDMLFDAGAIESMADLFPDWNFHLFGKGAKLTKTCPNVITHGEKPFADVAPYIRHADIGLAPYGNAPNAGYLSQSSLKMIQYTYCRLPIVAPGFAAAGRPHVLPYTDKNDTAQAFAKAASFDRATIDSSQILSWDEMLNEMLKVIA